MDMSVNVDFNVNAPSDDNEKQLTKGKPFKFRILEPIQPTSRASQTPDKDCMQPKILLEKLCPSANRTTSRGYVRVRDIPSCCRVAPTMDNGHTGMKEKKEGTEIAGTENQNHPPTDDRERPSGSKRLKTPSSTLNKKKPYRAARSDASEIPPAVDAASEAVQDGTGIVVQRYRRDSPNDTTTQSCSYRTDSRQSDDRAFKTISESGNLSTTESSEAMLETDPRAKEDLTDNGASEHPDQSEKFMRTLAVDAKSSDDHCRAVDSDVLLGERPPVHEMTDITDAEGLTVDVDLQSSRETRDSEKIKAEADIDALTLLLPLGKNSGTEDAHKSSERRDTRKTPASQRVTTDATPVRVGTKTRSTCLRRKDMHRRFSPFRGKVRQLQRRGTFYRNRSTRFYSKRKKSLPRLQRIRSMTGTGRCHVRGQPISRRDPCTMANISKIKPISVVFAGHAAEGLAVPVTDVKASTSSAAVSNSTSKLNHATEQPGCMSNLTWVQVNGCGENPETTKPSSVDETFRTTERSCPSVLPALSTNPPEVPKVQHVYRSIFDNFAESEVSIGYRADDIDNSGAFHKAEPTTAEAHVTGNRRGNIFEKFRSPMQNEELATDCVNLNKKRDRDRADRRQVPDMSRAQEDPCPNTILADESNDIREILGDYDSDSTECCKYDELDEIYSDNQASKDVQLDGLLAERTDNFCSGFSVFNILSDSDDNLIVDESMDSQAVETSEQKQVQEPQANSEDEDLQLKKLRSTAYRTYTRKRKQMLLQKGLDDTGPTAAGPGRTNASPLAENRVAQSQEDDARFRSRASDSKAGQSDGKGRPRSSKKTKMKAMKRRRKGHGKSTKTVPASRHALHMMDRKRTNATKKRTNVCKEFTTRSKTRNKKTEGQIGPVDSSAPKDPEFEAGDPELTPSNSELTSNSIQTSLKGEFLNEKKIGDGRCRRRQGRPPTNKSLRAGCEMRPSRRRATASKSKEDTNRKEQPPKMDILSRELGPRYNWLEQKIQAMQKSCSDEGLDSKVQPLSLDTQTSYAGHSKRASNINYESDDDCRGPKAKRWSGEDRGPRPDDHFLSDYTAPKEGSEDDHHTTGNRPEFSEIRLSTSTGDFDDSYDPVFPPSRGPQMSSNTSWSVAAPGMATSTTIPLSFKLIRSSPADAAPSLDTESPLAYSKQTAPLSLNELDEEGGSTTSEQRRPLSLSPSASPAVYSFDHRLSHSLGISSSMIETRLVDDEPQSQLRRFSVSSLNRVPRSPFVRDFSIESAASSSQAPSVADPASTDMLHAEPGLDSSYCHAPFDLSLSSVRSHSLGEVEVSNDHFESTASSRNCPQNELLTPLPLTVTPRNKSPSDTESVNMVTRKPFLESEVNEEGLFTVAAIPGEVVTAGIERGDTVIDLTADVDPVSSNSDISPQVPKAYLSQESVEQQPQDSHSTPVLRSIKYEYVRRLEMYERLSKVSKIKDQEIAILESERKRVKKELDCLKNIFVRATTGLPQESDERTEIGFADGTEMVGGSPAAVESTWSTASVACDAKTANQAHRREATVRLVASRSPPKAHSAKMDLSTYTYLKCQYDQGRLKAEEESGETHTSHYGPLSGATETDSEKKVLLASPLHSASSSARSSSLSSAGKTPSYRPAQVTGPCSPRNQVWSSVQSGECLNVVDSCKPGSDPASAVHGSSRQATSTESDLELVLASPRLQKSEFTEGSLANSQLTGFDSGQAVHLQELSHRREQTSSEPPTRQQQHRRNTGIGPFQELDSTSQPPRPSSYTAGSEGISVPPQLVAEKPLDWSRQSPPAASNIYDLQKQQAKLNSINPEDDGRFTRRQDDYILKLTHKTTRFEGKSDLATSRRNDADNRNVDATLCPDDNQYQVVDLSRSCDNRPKSGSQRLELSQNENATEREAARNSCHEETPIALDLKSVSKDVSLPQSTSLALDSSGGVERSDVLDELPRRVDEDRRMLENCHPRRYTMPSRIDDRNLVAREGRLAKNQCRGETDLHCGRKSSSVSTKVPYLLPDGVDRGDMEPVDLKVSASKGSIVERDQPITDKMGGVPPLRHGVQYPVSTQKSSDAVMGGCGNDFRSHSIRNLIPDIVPQQQQQQQQLSSRDRLVKSFDSPKTVVGDAERTTTQINGDKHEGPASPRANGRRTHRRWPKQQKSPQPSYYPDRYGLSSNLQDMNFMVNSISSGSYFRGGSTATEHRPASDFPSMPVENEQRATTQTEMLNSLSPTYNARVLAQKPGYEHEEKRGPPLNAYSAEAQTLMQQRPAETGVAFAGPQARDTSGLHVPPTNLEAARPHARETVYRLDESSSITGAPSMQRYGERQQTVVVRGNREDAAHLQTRHPPASFKPSISPVIAHQDSAFVSLASQRRDTVTSRQPIERLPQNDPGRLGNQDLYHLRQHPGSGAYPQPVPPPPASRQVDAQMQQRFYVAASMSHPTDARQAPPVDRNDRIPLPVFQKSGSQPFVQQVRQENVHRIAPPEMASHRLAPHRMDLVPSSDADGNAYGAVMLHQRQGPAELPRGEAGVVPARHEDGLLFPGQSRSDSMVFSRIVMPAGTSQRSAASAAGFQDTAASLRNSGPEPMGYLPHHAPGSDPSRVANWRVNQEYTLRSRGQDSQQLQEASRHISARQVEQLTLGVAGVSDPRDPLQLRSHHPVNDRYLPSYIESVAGASQQVTPYRSAGLLQPPVPSGYPHRQPGKEELYRPSAPQRHPDQVQPQTAVSMHLFQPTQGLFPVPPGIVNPAFGGAGLCNPVQVERIHLRPGYDPQKNQENFGPAAYSAYERQTQLLNGRSGLSGLAVHPSNMVPSRQQRPDELPSHSVKTSQAPIHQGLEGFKQQQQQQQQQQQLGQVAKTIDYICEVCRKPAMFVCSACKGVAYCSTDCQAISWQTKHSSLCRQP